MAKYYTPTRLSENIRETPEGFLLCLEVPIARTGEMVYGEDETPLETDDEGKILISRDADEVFNPDTVASFEGKAVTIKHPNDFVDPNNWSYLAKGIIQNVRKAKEKDENGEEILLADLLITDAAAIRLVKAGLREVSCGYEAEYEQTGEGKGRQTKIIGNHLALVEQGRAGESYAIKDHKGIMTMNKIAEQMKKLFGTAIDEAVSSEKKDDDKKAKDEGESKEDKSMDKGAYDELVKMCKDLGEKIEKMGQPKDESSEKKDDKPMDEEKKDDEKSKDADAGAQMEERLKAVEAAVAKLLEMQEKGSAQDEDDDEDGESEDEESEKKDTKTGDQASKTTGLEKTKNAKSFDQGEASDSATHMTAEKMNELNSAHWARK